MVWCISSPYLFFFAPLKVSIETFNEFRAIKPAIPGFKDPRQSPKKTLSGVLRDPRNDLFRGPRDPENGLFWTRKTPFFQGPLALAAKVKNSKRLIWREKQSLVTLPKGRGYKPRRNRGGVVSDFGVYLEGTPNGPPDGLAKP